MTTAAVAPQHRLRGVRGRRVRGRLHPPARIPRRAPSGELAIPAVSPRISAPVHCDRDPSGNGTTSLAQVAGNASTVRRPLWVALVSRCEARPVRDALGAQSVIPAATGREVVGCPGEATRIDGGKPGPKALGIGTSSGGDPLQIAQVGHAAINAYTSLMAVGSPEGVGPPRRREIWALSWGCSRVGYVRAVHFSETVTNAYPVRGRLPSEVSS